MKKWYLLVFIILVSSSLQAQGPINWKNGVQKKDAQTYEIRLTATLEDGWHAYSQTQPESAIPMPTKITFNKNPLVKLIGKVKELGNMEVHKNQTLNTEDWRYGEKVDFVQVMQLKGQVKTNITGTIIYMVCTDEQCLPPTTVKFNLSLKP